MRRTIDDDLVGDVRAWIEKNPNAPPRSIKLAERLLTHPDMAPAWRELAKRNIEGKYVMVMAMDAAIRAEGESLRLSSAEESERLRAVEDAAQKLIAAIAQAPFLGEVNFFAIDGKARGENRRPGIVFSWRPSGTAAAKPYLTEPIVELTALLNFAAKRAAELRKFSTQYRTVKRQRRDPAVAAFVRYLAVMLQHKTGQKMMGTIARIATCALDRRREPITKEQVESILRSPSE